MWGYSSFSSCKSSCKKVAAISIRKKQDHEQRPARDPRLRDPAPTPVYPAVILALALH